MVTCNAYGLAIRALKMAIALRSPPRGCLFHSDRGSQYFSHDYQKVLRHHRLKASMSGKGNCYDNAAVDRRGFSRTSGVHPLHLQDDQGRTDLAPHVGDPTQGRNRHLPIL